MADITIDQVTTTLPTGDGVFDVLMRSIDSHLDKQYLSGRIKGSDYATVYLGALQAVLQQSIAFVLTEQKVEKEIELLDKEINFKTQQILTETEQTTLVKENHEKVAYETDYILPSQKAQIDSQKVLVDQQKLTEIENTTLVKEKHETEEKNNMLNGLQDRQNALLVAQKDGVIAETARQDLETTERIAASQANTTLKQQLGDAQEQLYIRQKTGLDDDAQFKVFKTLVDLRTTGMTQEMPGLKNGTNIGANQITNEILSKVGLTGITNIVADV